MKKTPLPKPPVALACGLLEDGNRALFLCRRNEKGEEELELPCALLFAGDNPVSSLAIEFRRQTGIDGEVHEVIIEGKHNAGSRKRRLLVPALAFKLTAKSASVRVSSEFCSYKWLERRELSGKKIGRLLRWMVGKG